MNSHSYVSVPNESELRALWALDQWLPQRSQIISGVQLRIHEVVGATGDERENEADPRTTSMRQGLGLVVVSALVAGLLPFLVNWVVGARAGTVAPLARLAQQLHERSDAWSNSPFTVWADSATTIAGLDPRLPGWLAAFFSALGTWINLPLSWLSGWLVYGLVVLLLAKFFGATTTLQRLYAATSYAFVPLVLTGLDVIPCVGWIAALVGSIWMVVIYVHAVRVVTDLETGRAVLAVVLPAAALLLVGLLLTGIAAMTFVTMLLF